MPQPLRASPWALQLHRLFLAQPAASCFGLGPLRRELSLSSPTLVSVEQVGKFVAFLFLILNTLIELDCVELCVFA